MTMQPKEFLALLTHDSVSQYLRALVLAQIRAAEHVPGSVGRSLSVEEQIVRDKHAERLVKEQLQPVVTATLARIVDYQRTCEHKLTEFEKFVHELRTSYSDQLSEQILEIRDQVVRDAAALSPLKEHLTRRVQRHRGMILASVCAMGCLVLLATGLTIAAAFTQTDLARHILLVAPVAGMLLWAAFWTIRIIVNCLHGIEDANHREVALESFLQLRAQKQLGKDEGALQLLALMLQPPASTLLKDAHKFPFTQIAEALGLVRPQSKRDADS